MKILSFPTVLTFALCGLLSACGDDAGTQPDPNPGGLSCGTGQIECDGLCVDPQTDEAYCGASGACGDGGGSAGEACEAGFSCVSGACEAACNAIDCDDGIACNGTETCSETTGRCESSGSTCTGDTICNTATDECVGACGASQIACDGLCIDPLTDESFCGATAGCGDDGGVAGVVCDAGFSCENGSCAPSCAGCLVGGECFADGSVNPANACQVCDIAQSTTAFVDDDGRACSDGLLCTTGDVCTAGACAGSPIACDDGVACNGAETCSEATGCVSPGNACTNGGICDVDSDSCVAACDGCLVEGLCIADGAPNPASPCEFCDAASDATVYTTIDPYVSNLAVTDAVTSGVITSTAGFLDFDGSDPRSRVTLTADAENPGVYAISDITGGNFTIFVEAVAGGSVGETLAFPGTITETACGVFDVTAGPQAYLGQTWTPGFEVVPASYRNATELVINWFIVDNPSVNDRFEPFEATTIFTIPTTL